MAKPNALPAQQIDLYHPTLRRPRIVFGARLAGQILLLGVAALIGWYALAQFEFDARNQQLRALQQRLAAARDQQTQLIALLTPENPAAQQDASAELIARREQQLALLGELQREAGQHATPLADYFAGLARGVPEGLWLESIEIQPISGDIALSGQTRDPALLPELIRSLGEQHAFSGAAFSVATLQRNADNPTALSFTLRSRPGAPGDEQR
jgi:Tfp pilus assembly protein PilN